MINLVPVSADDLEFCFSVTEAVMRGHVEATWGRWERCAEKAKYAEGFRPELHHLIVVEAERAGIVEVEEHHDYVQLGTIYLLPAFQGKGIGAFVLSQIVATAEARPVRLRLLAVNTRAQQFYARHGFVVTSKTPERVYMERKT